MKARKVIGAAIVLLSYVFPFRWSFIEHADVIKAQGIDNSMVYLFYSVLAMAGFFTGFLLMGETREEERTVYKKAEFPVVQEHSKAA